MKEIKLPSGAVLKVGLAPFADARALYQAVLREMRSVNISFSFDIETIGKDLFCVGFSSPDIESALWQCFKRCLYDSGKGAFKIDQDTFESAEARGDYLQVCAEVAKENIFPFVKSLWPELKALIPWAQNFPGSPPETTS